MMECCAKYKISRMRTFNFPTQCVISISFQSWVYGLVSRILFDEPFNKIKFLVSVILYPHIRLTFIQIQRRRDHQHQTPAERSRQQRHLWEPTEYCWENPVAANSENEWQTTSGSGRTWEKSKVFWGRTWGSWREIWNLQGKYHWLISPTWIPYQESGENIETDHWPLAQTII